MTGVQTCALPISGPAGRWGGPGRARRGAPLERRAGLGPLPGLIRPSAGLPRTVRHRSAGADAGPSGAGNGVLGGSFRPAPDRAAVTTAELCGNRRTRPRCRSERSSRSATTGIRCGHRPTRAPPAGLIAPWALNECSYDRGWCARRDSNPHTRRHQNLNLGRLPVPPLALTITAYRPRAYPWAYGTRRCTLNQIGRASCRERV
mgnify:CR=1 FL=1